MRDTQKIIDQGHKIITARVDMTAGEMAAFLKKIDSGNAFEAIHEAFLLGAGVGYSRATAKK